MFYAFLDIFGGWIWSKHLQYSYTLFPISALLYQDIKFPFWFIADPCWL